MNALADADLDAQIAADYREMAARFRALAAMRREEARTSKLPSLKSHSLNAADTWERSAQHLDAKARVFASFCPA